MISSLKENVKRSVNLHEIANPSQKNEKSSKFIDRYFRLQESEPLYFDDLSSIGQYSMRIAKGGHMMEIKNHRGHKPDNLIKERGDVIEGFGRKSRNNFLKQLLSIDYGKMGAPYFYTLTYPGEWSKDPRQWKSDLATLIKRLRRHYPELCGTWRLEPQRRGAPHFCGFLWGCDDLENKKGKEWFSRQWFEVVGSGDQKHLRAGTGISRELIHETRIFYMAKYQTKAEKGGVEQQFDYPVGRYWGFFERKRLSITMMDSQIDQSMFFKVRRVGRKILKKRLGKNRFRNALNGTTSGLWLKMSDTDSLRLLNLFMDDREQVLDKVPTDATE